MVDWYISSVKYGALPTFTASHAYNVGDIIRPTSPAVTAQYAQRCTTAGTSGTSEPVWTLSLGGTTTTGGATFTNIAGGAGSTYNWNGPAGNLASLTYNQPNINAAAGDRLFVDSAHSESGAGFVYNFGASSGVWPEIKIISVNAAGSVPPVPADIMSGAAITNTSTNFALDAFANLFWDGFTFTQNAAGPIYLNISATKNHYFKNCAFVFGNTSAACVLGSNNPAKVTLDNTTVQFDATGQGIKTAWASDYQWINTPSAIAGSILPSTLFLAPSGGGANLITCRGVDLSAITGTLTGAVSTSLNKILLEGCKIASGVTRYGSTIAATAGGDELELVNCYDGANVLNERYTPVGKVITSRSTYMTGGAADDTGNYCLEMVSNADSGQYASPLETFWFDVENTLTGSRTATIEIVSSALLNNVDLHAVVEYQGTSGSPVSAFADTLGPLDSSSAIPTSTQAWTGPPSTPVYQHIQFSISPQQAGRVRAKLKLAKVSTTVYVNPQIAIT